MKIRDAKISDATPVHCLVTSYAELDTNVGHASGLFAIGTGAEQIRKILDE